MLLIEQVRLMASESNKLIYDATEYSYSGSSWGTLHNYGNITLSEAAIIVFQFDGAIESTGGSPGGGGYRLKIGSVYVCGRSSAAAVGYQTFTGMAYLAAGTYNVLMEGIKADAGVGVEPNIKNFLISLAKFVDLSVTATVAYSGQITHNLTARLTSIGAIANGSLFIFCAPKTGDGSQAGLPSLTVDGAAASWVYSHTDSGEAGQSGIAYAYYYVNKTAGADHTISLSGGTGTQYITIIFTPWIMLDSLYTPVTLNFPSGSTFYALLEPFLANPSKTSYLGKVRALSFGVTTDYHSSATGIGLLSHNYTFDIVYPSNIVWSVAGLWGCISHIGVDIR